MINLEAVFIANGLGVALMVTVLVSHYRKPNYFALDDRIFVAMCYMTLSLCIIEAFSFLIDGKEFLGAQFLSRLLNSSLFTINTIFSSLWVIYIEFKLHGNLKHFTRKNRIIFIPAVLICILAGMNLFTDTLFSVSENNIYQRLPLAYSTYLVTYFYLLYGAVNVIRNRYSMQNYMFMPVVLFLFPIFIGSLIQMFVYGIALIWVSVSFGMTALYINIQNEAIFLDSLTGLYNHAYMITYLDYIKNRLQKDLYGIMIDINSFKHINDTFGHHEGDRVLKAVANVLSQCVNSSGVAIRQGGDEFMLLKITDDESEIYKLKNTIQQKIYQLNNKHILQQEVSLSIGIGSLKACSGDTDTFLKLIDQQMYLDKKSYYSAKSHDRRSRNR